MLQAHPNQEVTNLRKAGQLTEAYTRGYELLKENPDDKYLANAIGWVLHDKIKQLVSEAKQLKSVDNGLSINIYDILREYAKLNVIRPDFLFSFLLIQTFQFPKELKFLPKFMMWAGIDSFRPDDFQTQDGNEGVVYESLVEKVARKTAKVAHELSLQEYSNLKEIQEFTIALIDLAFAQAKIQKPEWLNYHKALLLHKLGRSKDSQELLIPFVKQKRSDYWTWHALAKVVEISEPKRALTLYAKACLTCKDENFGVNVFEDLSRLASQQNELALAKWSANQSFTIRNKNEWHIPQSLRNLLDADWYIHTENIPNPDNLLKDVAADAEKIIWVNCSEYEANYIESFQTKNDKKMVKFGLTIQGESQEIVCPAQKLLNNHNLVFGEPVTVTIDESDNRLTIIALEKREAGKCFDSLMIKTGVFRSAQGGFGFMDDVFIPPNLASQLENAQTVSFAVVKKLDKKKNKWGLTAVSIYIP
ncbi:MAG: hypothetical protein WCK96_02335 [Methylococcales bacterium]